MTAVPIDFAKYYRYDEVIRHLHCLADEYPDLVNLFSIGQSFRGRELWIVEMTNHSTGDPKDKPAYYIDAVTHPEEVSGAMVAQYTIWHLLTEYGKDEMVTQLLDSQVVYVLPFLNPDAYEICMDRLYYEWHGTARYLPGDDQVGPGLHYADLDGDGYILKMRVPDPKGEWKISDVDSRLMIRRAPYEFGGAYYRVLPEGRIEDYDGASFEIPRPRDGNLNRNFPVQWAGEVEQYGAGEYPMSEPEVRALFDFFNAHPNICGVVDYHTNAGVILPPFRPDDDPMSDLDESLFRRIGQIAAQETGYRLVMTEREFSGKASKPRRGTSGNFTYGQKGVLSFVIELWDLYRETGIGDHPVSFQRELSEDDQMKLLAWNDKYFGGEAFREWRPFDHPQLGPVEIGGWKTLLMFRNPPPQLLPEMARKNTLFTVKHALAAPRIRVARAEVVHVEGNVFRIEAIIENHGFLSTHVTDRALAMKAVDPCIASLDLPASVVLVGGSREVSIGHLAGWSDRPDEYTRFSRWSHPAKKAEWIVRTSGESVEVTIHAHTSRAGHDQITVSLG